MALPAAFLDELRARTPMAAVVGRAVRLARSGRQWKGCCPFHGEKTPSFYVYDDHFHCFGCGAHGDAISFVMQSQGAGFPEAVDQLAAEAGLEVPKPSHAAAEAEARRAGLHEVLEAAEAEFQRRLFLPEGRPGLDYLRGRGLTEDTIRRFGLGWSGEGRGQLAAALGRAGITPDQLTEAGLLRDDQRELFYNRVTFPIRDRRGRVVSFGGRTLGDGQPKYLNGPETPVFSKRRTLYGLDLARAGLRDGQALVVVEGYMDVIALHQAGFTGAVAPLGTALTEEQLAELWRFSPAPVLCFDGDAAGARAAARAAELALPLLTPEQTLVLASLSAGDDPDTLVRRDGPRGMQAVLAAARPLSAALFDLLAEGGARATPEQQAAFRTKLETAARRIADRALAGEYRRVLLDRFYNERPRRGGRPGPRPVARPPRPVPSGAVTAAERGRILVAILLHHPGIAADVTHAFAGVALPPALDRLRAALLDAAEADPVLDSPGLMSHLTQTGLAAEAAQALSALPPLPECASADAMPAAAEAGWWHFFGLMTGIDRLDEEVASARTDLSSGWDPKAQFRLIALCTAREALQRGDPWGEHGGEPDA